MNLNPMISLLFFLSFIKYKHLSLSFVIILALNMYLLLEEEAPEYP